MFFSAHILLLEVRLFAIEISRKVLSLYPCPRYPQCFSHQKKVLDVIIATHENQKNIHYANAPGAFPTGIVIPNVRRV